MPYTRKQLNNIKRKFGGKDLRTISWVDHKIKEGAKEREGGESPQQEFDVCLPFRLLWGNTNSILTLKALTLCAVPWFSNFWKTNYYWYSIRQVFKTRWEEIFTRYMVKVVGGALWLFVGGMWYITYNVSYTLYHIYDNVIILENFENSIILSFILPFYFNWLQVL